MSDELTLRNVEIEGQAGLDLTIANGTIAAIGERLRGGTRELDGAGGALLPGLVDHHLHLFATAARFDSVVLEDVRSPAALAERLRRAAAERPVGQWIRALGYHESHGGELTLELLDAMVPDHPLRLQHQSGALWLLNSRALERVVRGETPSALERDTDGRPTGRIFRGDLWLRRQIGAADIDFAALGRTMSAFGITAVTDTSPATDAEATLHLVKAQREGHLPQRLTLMSEGPLPPPSDDAYTVGPVKILLDAARLPPFEEMRARIAQARSQARPVAIHCVTAAELAFTLAALQAEGAVIGDRIEHGGIISEAAIAELRQLELAVVTQPGFVSTRGDRYLADVEPQEQGDLYRCASLLAAGVPVAASSDAPYGPLDPWAGMRAAISRRTAEGRHVAVRESVPPQTALGLYLSESGAPGRSRRRLAEGAPADLCLLRAPLAEALAALSCDLVAATLIGGRLVYQA